MPISFSCPRCGHRMETSRDHAGRAGLCVKCRAPFTVPAEAQVISGESDRLPTVLLPTPAPAKLPQPPPDETPTVPPAPSSSGSGRSPKAPDVPPEVAKALTDPRNHFGRFVILGELGRGGMGAVYKAWDERLKRVVALKTLLEGDKAAPDTIARFHREAEAVARLRHPNIVSVHEVGEIEGKHYLAMDFVEGESLEKRLGSEKKIALNKALEAMRDVAHAVHYAHEQGVIHRDLKPQNIIIASSDRPYVVDFGLARVRELGDRSKLTKTGAAMGTPAYMPPEQAGGGGQGAVSERSDVYSLGATLYHVLTGRPPFQGETEWNVLAAVLTRDPLPPSKLAPRAAGDLETICLKALEKEPARRYGTAEALGLELGRYLAGESIEARPIGRLERVWRRARRNRPFVAAVFAVLACAGGVSTWALVERARRARAEREVVERALADARRAGPRGTGALARWIEAFQLTAGDQKHALEAACALGEAAAVNEQWLVAELALARVAEIDEGQAEAGRTRLGQLRHRVAREHRDAVAAVISATSAGGKPLEALGGGRGGGALDREVPRGPDRRDDRERAPRDRARDRGSGA